MVPLHDARIVIAGQGEAAEAKARLFARGPAERIRIVGQAMFDPESYARARLAFIATEDDPARAAAAARASGAWVNVVDRPDLCQFTTPAIVDRGAVVGAIATGGAAPVLAADLRQALEAAWPEGLGEVARLLAHLRDEARASYRDPLLRRAALRRLVRGEAAEAAMRSGAEAALPLARAVLADPQSAAPRLITLQAPAQVDLMTLRDLRLLGAADQIIADAGVASGLLALARRDAPRRIVSSDAGMDAGWLDAPGLTVRITAAAPEAC